MAQIAMVLPPPRLWQQFEELTRDVVAAIFNDPSAHNYGNQGAAQNGVDVYCHENSDGRLIGVQCKRLGKTNANGAQIPGGLKASHLIAEIDKAKNYPNPLSHYIIATTDTRSTAIQDEAIRLNASQKASQGFTFDVMFWDDYVSMLHKDAKLLQWYYNEILQLKGVYSIDDQIIYLVHMAFSRPAFTTPLLSEEGGTKLFDALKDTETALNTGQLKDRETRGIVRVAPAGIGALSDGWQSEAQEVLRLVKEARSLYKKAKHDGDLVELTHRIEVRSYAVASELDRLRGDAIRVLNGMLVRANLPEVVSPL